MAIATATWNQSAALATYRATAQRCAAWYEAADCFDRPSLQRRDIVAADKACQAAWERQDMAGLERALGVWERAICGAAA